MSWGIVWRWHSNVGIENSSGIVGDKSIKFGMGSASLLLTVGSGVLINPEFWLSFSCVSSFSNHSSSSSG